MNFYKRIRAQQKAEREYELIRTVAEGGQEAARFYFAEQGRTKATDSQCQGLWRACVLFVDRYPAPFWREGKLFCVAAMDWTGPGVEVVL